jgi:hypothetical protein
MLATICVRLAIGLVLFLPLIWHCLPHPRFVRTQFISALGLLVVAVLSSWNESSGVGRGLLLAGCAAALAGAASWTLDPAPAGRWLILATIVILAVAIFREGAASDRPWWLLAGGISSAALLGSALTAMLTGHSYLISPGLALTPLLRMLAALFVAAGLRALVCGSALGFWLSERGGHTLTTEDLLWLPVRWIVGIAAPIAFGGMALSAARIRSTQSATGILYVAVVCAILGELIGLLLETTHGWPL